MQEDDLPRRRILKSGTLRLAAAALFAALISVAAVFSIPLPPPLPPFSPAVFFVLLAGLLLGPAGAGAAVGAYLLLGSLGLPVFSNGSGGVGHFLGPTGGFLVGYLAAAITAGALADRKNWRAARSFLAAAAGVAVLYAIGLPWMKMALSAKSATLRTIAVMLAPYFIGDLARSAAAAFPVRALKPVLGIYFAGENE